jgi:hypothetical protein
MLAAGVSACASTDPVPSSAQLRRDYDKTLTKDEQKAAIDEMQSAAAKKQGTTDPNQTASTGSAPAEPQE